MTQTITPTKNKIDDINKERLFSPDTWPGKSKAERQFLANQVVDAFHKKVSELGLDIQWQPKYSHFVVKSGNITQKRLVELVNESYVDIQSKYKST